MVNGEKTTLEVIAPTIEEAVSRGLNDLGLTEEAVEIEVLDSGSRGFLGLGSRQARVRLIVKGSNRQDEPDANLSRGEPSRSDVSRGESTRGESTHPHPVRAKPVRVEPVRVEPVRGVPEHAAPERGAPERGALPMDQFQPAKGAQDGPAQEVPLPRGRNIPADQPVEDDRTLQVARETVSELLEKMKVTATVTARYGEGLDPKEDRPIQVEIHGNDLSILIGRKSETLNALQYIACLMVGKELEKWVTLQIDVEGYRARRERALRQLARRMADQAINSDRRQVLEPMPPNERRIIHLELRDHPRVITESIGDEPNRKVTIVLKKE
jgi:spoIIIJ-associated protein